MDLELVERAVIADTVGEKTCIFLTELYRAEQVIAKRIRRLASEALPRSLHHFQRTRLELVAERKLRWRQLTDNGNVEITGRDLREAKTPRRK